MSVMWIEEIVNYSPINDLDFKYEELYPCIFICENNNEVNRLNWRHFINDDFLMEPILIEDFIWCELSRI